MPLWEGLKELHTMSETTEWATIGKIVAPFGIRGELKVRSFTDIPDRFVTLEAIYLGSDHARRVIKGVRPYKGEMLLLKLDGIDDATTAETLRNDDLCIPADELAQLPPDAYYQHDILGLRVLRLDDRFVGVISEIMATGGNDVYVIKADDGRQWLIPAIKQVIKQVDLVRRVMYIDPISGLLDDDAEVVDPTEEEVEEADETQVRLK
jgi:16S rRNA processing protein RimM